MHCIPSFQYFSLLWSVFNIFKSLRNRILVVERFQPFDKEAGEEWQKPKLALLSVVALLVAAEATAEAKTCHCGPTRTRLQCLNFFWAVTAPAILPQLLCFNRIFETNVARFACKYFLSCWDTLYRGAIEARMLNYSTNLLCVLKKTQAGIYQKEANNIWASSFTFFAASFAV